MMENGFLMKGMELEYKNGRMDLDMKANGIEIKLAERVYFIIKMAIFMMDIGRIIKPMVSEC